MMVSEHALQRSSVTLALLRLRNLAAAIVRPDAALIRASLLMLVVNAAGLLLAFVVQVLIARWAGPQDFGHYVYAMAILNVLAVAGKMGYDTATLRFVASLVALRSRELQSFLRASMKDALTSSLLCTAVAIASIAALAAAGSVDAALASVFITGALIIPLHGLTSVVCARIQALGKAQLASALQTVLRPLLILMGLGVAIVAGGELSARTAMVTTSGAALVVLLVALATSRRQLARVELIDSSAPTAARDWRAVSGVMLLITVFDMLINQADVLLLGMFHGGEEVGLYSPAARIAVTLQFALNACNAVVASQFAALYAQGRTEELQRRIRAACACVLLVSAAILLALLVAGQSVLGLFGDAYSGSLGMLHVLLIGRACNALFGVAGYVLLMTQQHRAAAWILGFSLLAEVAAGCLLIPNAGAMGAAWTSVVGAAVWGITMAVWAHRRTGLNCTIFGSAR